MRWAAAAVVLLLAAAQVWGLVSPDPEIGHWRSAEARAEYEAAYREVLATVPAPDETRDVSTAYGSVRVYTWRGSAPGAPVVLLPGRSSGAPMWVENLPSWIGKRTVHALDPIGDAGLSAQSVPLEGIDDQAEWIAQALTGLGAEDAHVVAHSFGGATAAAFAVRHPELLASLALLEPVLVLRPLPASMYFWATLTQLPAPRSWKDRALAEIGGATVEEVRERTPMSRMIDLGASGYSAAVPMPKELTDDEWRRLDGVPVRLDIGGESPIAGGVGAAERMRALLPDATVTVWPGGTHSLPMDEHERIGEELLGFWDGAERR